MYVAGGDGTSIEDFIAGDWWTSNEEPIVTQTRTTLTRAARWLPEVETVPGLASITLSAGAFEVGWKIGSTLNTRWLHLAGVGLGVAPSNGPWVHGKWVYVPPAATGFLNSIGHPEGGWVLDYMTSDGSIGQTYCTPTGTSLPCPASSDEAQMYTGVHAQGEQEQWEVRRTGITCGSGSADCFTVFIPVTKMLGSGLTIDQALRVYNGQPFDIATGWRVDGDCGDTTGACSYPGTQQNPVSTWQQLRCELSGEPADCGASQPLVCVGADASGYFGGAGSTACGLGDSVENQLNCAADPADFDCPSTTGDGATFRTTGGGGGGGGDEDGTATSPSDEPCKFDGSVWGDDSDIKGLELWNMVNAEHAYDEECAEAYARLRSLGLLDSNNLPTQALLDEARSISLPRPSATPT